jgi:uncharacterized membrane-anchored protein YitT (DUF2179 family)
MEKEKKYLAAFYWKDYITIVIGVAMFAIGFLGFIVPNEIVAGGLGGVSLLLRYTLNVPVSVTFFVVNSILVIIAWFVLGKQYVMKALFGVVSVIIILAIAEQFITEALISADPLMASIIGAICCGAGLGLVYSVNGSTGGTDIVGAVITKYRYISMGRGLMYIDVVIILGSFLIFQSLEKVIYGFIIVFVMYTTADMVINGARQSVQFIIFSKKYDEIASHINSELGRGCTVVDGVVWYSQEPSKVLIVLARKTEATSIFRIVKGIDEDAFISQSNVVGVYGKGFDQIK